MSKENKIIEEMAKVTSEALMSELGIRLDDKFLLRLAKHFYNAGYSKQSEVVRCKDCRHWYSPNGDDAHYCRIAHGLNGIVAEEDFCSYAKKKGGAE